MKLGEKIEALRSAGFPVRYVDYDDAEPPLYVAWHDPQDRPEGMMNPQPWVDLCKVARGEDSAGQAQTVDRSNYRSLERAYPDIWLPLSYSNVDTLGALVRDLDGHLIAVLTALREQNPVYDEEDLSKLEDEEITESYRQFARDDIRAALPERVGDLWDEMTADEDETLVWSVVADLELSPVHDGLSVQWETAKLAREVARRLETRGPTP